MKKLIAVAALLVSASSFAISEASSWEEIRAEVKADHKLTMTRGATFVGQIVSAFDVCIDGENFKTTREFPFYEIRRVSRSQDNDGDNDGYTSVLAGYRTLVFPINYETTRRVCNNRDKNCRNVSVMVEQELVKEITVKKFVKTVGRDKRDVYKTLFTKEYFIPTCK